jgi:MGT family glycosyltransferase
MKIIIAAPPFLGHLNPMLSIAQILMSHGHEIVVTTATFLRDRVEGTGAKFVPLLAGADYDSRQMTTLFAEHSKLKPGLELLEAQVGDMIEPLGHQYAGLQKILAEFDADAIVSDAMFNGTLPLLLNGKTNRPVIIHICPHQLFTERDDGAPTGAGLPPAENQAQQEEYRAIRKVADAACFNPLKARLDRRLAELGIGPTTLPYVETLAALPDLFLQPTVPGFEYPRRNLPSTVCFIGCLPPPPSKTPDPDWIDDLDGSRQVVLVTQGTLANFDLGQLIGPTLDALAEDPDLLVIVTTGGASLSSIPTRIPTNARVADFLPFERLLSRVDVVVSNGGYGTVNMSLKAGIPLVVAGLTEDKADITARVAWSGAGINLATNEASSAAVRNAVRAILNKPAYRQHAKRLAAEFATYDTEEEVLRLVEGCVQAARDGDRVGTHPQPLGRRG